MPKRPRFGAYRDEPADLEVHGEAAQQRQHVVQRSRIGVRHAVLSVPEHAAAVHGQLQQPQDEAEARDGAGQLALLKRGPERKLSFPMGEGGGGGGRVRPVL